MKAKMPLWDRVIVQDGSQATNPQPFVLKVETIGCGCCAAVEIIGDKAAAVALVKAHIKARKAEIAAWTRWLTQMRKAEWIIAMEPSAPRRKARKRR